MLRGYLERLAFGRPVSAESLPSIPGRPLTFSQSDGSPSMVIGGSVFPMAAGLCRVLIAEQRALELGTGPPTLELGAGTGAVGIFAAALGARALLTDKSIARAAAQPVSYSADGGLDVLEGESDVLLDLLRHNADANQASADHPIRVEPLDWMQREHVAATLAASEAGAGFALVLGSDITYERDVHDGLAAAIASLLRPPDVQRRQAGGLALIAHETRASYSAAEDVQMQSFVAKAQAHGLHVKLSDLNVQSGSIGTLLRLSHAASAA